MEHAKTVRRRLSDFALSPPFERYFREILLDEADGVPFATDETFATAVNRLLYEYRYPDGSTVIDRFARRKDVDEATEAMARGFGDSVASIFEVVRDTPAAAELISVRCCLSELEHLVAPTTPAKYPPLAQGSFLVGTLVPVAGTELWTSFLDVAMVPASERSEMVTAVLQLALECPWLTHRHPEKRQAAVRKVALMHERFVARHGSDLVLVDGSEVADVYADLLISDDLAEEVKATNRASARRSVEDAGLSAAEHVLVHCHPLAGPSFYAGYPEVERAFRAGSNADPADLVVLREFVEDDGVPAWLMRRIVTEHLPSSEAALARALRKPQFSWERDGERLLASSPGDKEPAPRMSIVPTMCAGLA